MVPRLALDNLLRNPKRTATNVTSLMVGLILVMIIACVNVSFKGTLLDYFGHILHADLVISTTGPPAVPRQPTPQPRGQAPHRGPPRRARRLRAARRE